MKRLAGLLLFLLLALSAAGAHAATECHVTSLGPVAFGQVQPNSTAVTTTSTLNYSCSYNGGLLGGLFGTYVTICVSLGPDPQSSYNPRTLVNATSDTMNYNIYKDTNHTQVWGSLTVSPTSPLTITDSFTILANGTTKTGSVVIYGQVPASQANLAFGSYTGSLTASMNYRYNEVLLSLGGYPASCTTGGTGGGTSTSTNLAVTASVPPFCAVGTADDLNFGNIPGFINTNHDNNSLVRLTCTLRSPWQIGLDNGQHATGSTRRMLGTTTTVIYELYKEATYATRWGNTLNTDTLSGTGTGAEQAISVYGRVPVQTPVPAGSYSDVIQVTVTY
ncbi:spore coat protein U-like protein [Luteibacter rhizovicinus]|uniref:Spore coat protein U-like protein n=1 Tax=Luteibacter rhizovicinus TaxID=242606 RepID=A0A4R3YN76_9GAMM|nr:spore coat protein U domain-containing protein [Luteibacter rhizovicinus]TCV92313.1 spore coat protein U-like protein [Luteibacter rhizovicinus]